MGKKLEKKLLGTKDVHLQFSGWEDEVPFHECAVEVKKKPLGIK